MRTQKGVKGLGNRSVLQQVVWPALRSGLGLTILLSPDASGVWETRILCGHLGAKQLLPTQCAHGML